MKRCFPWVAVVGLALIALVASRPALGSEDKIGLLSSWLKDTSFKVRLKAAVLLGRTSDAGAVSPLCDALSDENYIVRGAAARALGNLGHPMAVAAVEPLLKMLKDEEPFVRKEAVHALERLAGVQSLDFFISALSNEEPLVRQTAVHLLSAMNTPEARSAVVPALGDSDPEVQAEAVTVVRGLGQADIESLLLLALTRKDNYQVQATAARLIGELKITAAMNQLADLLVSDEVVPEVKKEAAESLVIMKGTMNVSALVAQLNAQDRTNQDRTIKLLGLHGGAEAVDALLGLLKNADPFVRRQAVFALGDTGDPRAIPALELLLKSEDNPRYKDLIQRTLRKLKP
jgi:HEAT repeat protein